MFRINSQNKIITWDNIFKRFTSKYTESKFKSYKLFQQRPNIYYQSSLLPAIFGFSTLTIFSAGLSYHYSEDVREGLRPYLSKKNQLFLDEYLGPNNITRLKKKWDEKPQFEFFPSIFSSFKKDKPDVNQDRLDVKPIGTEIKEIVQVPLTTAEAVKINIQKEADRIQKLNEELKDRISQQITQLETNSTSVVLHLMEYENKIQQHNEKLKRAIEDDGTTKPNPWEDVSASTHLLNTAKLQYETEMRKLETTMGVLETATEDARKSKELNSNPILLTSQQVVSEVRYRLRQKQADVEKAQFATQITNQYKELIQQGRERFKQELASLGPNVPINWNKKRADKLNNDDLNTLIIHAHRRMNQLQARIAELEALEVLHIQSALDEQAKRHEVDLAQRLVHELDRERDKLALEKQSSAEVLKQQHETELRRALTRQATVHSEHVQQLLAIQREEIGRQHNLAVREALLLERDRMRIAIDGWRLRVEGLEAAVEGRADDELVAREAQDLWVACHALHTALSTSTGPGGVTRPLARFVASFEEAAQPTTVPVLRHLVAAIPTSALEHGVTTLHGLLKRFERVKVVCRRVAMVDECGGSLPVYAVSWLRSLFIMTPARLLEADTELESDAVGEIDTHQIVASAEQALCRHDVELAVRLLNLLHGMPRAVAHDWIVDATAFLETKQAADALSSYTSSKTAGSIPPVPTTPLAAH